MTRILFAMILCMALVACGGGGGGTRTAGGGTTTGTNPPATSPPGSPQLVSTGATGVDITVPGPSQTPTPNAQFLGTVPPGTPSGSPITLFSTGDVIHQGTTPTVLISGPGITGTSTVRISGSGDITILGQRALTSGSGIALDLNVFPSAVLGPRTVFIITGNDMTSFTGGLEVVP